MALNYLALGTAIKTAVLALNPDIGLLLGAETALIESYWQAIAKEIIDHYEANGEIMPGTFNVAAVPVTGIGEIT